MYNDCAGFKNSQSSYQNQKNIHAICCYPIGWYCDGYKGDKEDKREECDCCEKNRDHERVDCDFCFWKQEGSLKKEGCFNKENSKPNFDHEYNEECHCKKQKEHLCEEEKENSCNKRRCGFCNLFNCFCRRK